MDLRQRSESAGQTGRQSFSTAHTAQVRAWDFQGIPPVFGDGMGGVEFNLQLYLRDKHPTKLLVSSTSSEIQTST